jgi:transcriptional/translational regulatory protein YebC/TACO1
VRDALEKAFGPASSARFAYRATNTVPVGEETARTVFDLIETLEDSDDVQAVFANFEVAEDVLAKLTA